MEREREIETERGGSCYSHAPSLIKFIDLSRIRLPWPKISPFGIDKLTLMTIII